MLVDTIREKRGLITVPGTSTYANAARGERRIGLLGDSNFNRVEVKEMSNFVNNGGIIKYSYS